MEFSPTNPVIQRCMQGVEMEEKGQPDKAGTLFDAAWNAAENDFEKFTAAYYISRHQKVTEGQLKWLETTLRLGLKVNSVVIKSALPTVYSMIAVCYKVLGDPGNEQKYLTLSATAKKHPADKGPFYHGTRAALHVGDLLTPGGKSNYKQDLVMNHIYFTGALGGAGFAASLAQGEGPEHVYVVEPTGDFENDPNVTDKKFPGNPTRSYRSSEPLKIIGEVDDFTRLTPAELRQWRERLAAGKGEIIN